MELNIFCITPNVALCSYFWATPQVWRASQMTDANETVICARVSCVTCHSRASVTSLRLLTAKVPVFPKLSSFPIEFLRHLGVNQVMCCWKGRVHNLASLTRRSNDCASQKPVLYTNEVFSTHDDNTIHPSQTDKASAIGVAHDWFLLPVGWTLVIKLCNTNGGICSPQTTGHDVDASWIRGGSLY